VNRIFEWVYIWIQTQSVLRGPIRIRPKTDRIRNASKMLRSRRQVYNTLLKNLYNSLPYNSGTEPDVVRVGEVPTRIRFRPGFPYSARIQSTVVI
jgi:hypothetical protein